MYYTSIKLENNFLFIYFFCFCKNGGLTGDVLECCKNRWSYGGHDNSGQVQARTMKQKKLFSFVRKLTKHIVVFKNIHFE